MATIGKKKMKRIGGLSIIHDVLESELGGDAKFLEDRPEFWMKEEKQLYDILIAHEYRLKEKITEILNE